LKKDKCDQDEKSSLENEYITISILQDEHDEYQETQHSREEEMYDHPKIFQVSIEELEDSHIEVIGQGNFGTVYKAAILQPDGKEHCVAIKSLKQNEVAIHEFILLSVCKHKNILAPSELIGRKILITEYLKNGSIDNYLQITGPCNKNLFWKWAQEIAQGMKYLHNHGIIHLDLHVGNVLLRKNLQAVIGDFGQARAKTSSIDIPQLYCSQMLKFTFICQILRDGKEKISSKTDVLFFGWLLSTLLKVDYEPSWDAPDMIIDLQQGGLIKTCLNENHSARPTFRQILDYIESINK